MALLFLTASRCEASAKRNLKPSAADRAARMPVEFVPGDSSGAATPRLGPAG